jgi:hypothetical protein
VRRRYFVLTRKGLHYYVRQKDSGETHRRDLFGEHEGSIALGNIASIEIINLATDELAFVIVSKSGGRRYMIRAGTAELREKWVATLEAAIAPPSESSANSASVRTNSGSSPSRLSAGIRSSSSFPRVPTLLDFRGPPRTDNLLYVTVHSARLGVDLFLEPNLPWGMPTILERARHQVTCAISCRGTQMNDADSRDQLKLVLEGGSTVSIPLSRTLLRRSRGSAVMPLQNATLHKGLRLSWEAVTSPHASEEEEQPPQPPPQLRQQQQLQHQLQHQHQQQRPRELPPHLQESPNKAPYPAPATAPRPARTTKKVSHADEKIAAGIAFIALVLLQITQRDADAEAAAAAGGDGSSGGGQAALPALGAIGGAVPSMRAGGVGTGPVGGSVGGFSAADGLWLLLNAFADAAARWVPVLRLALDSALWLVRPLLGMTVVLGALHALGIARLVLRTPRVPRGWRADRRTPLRLVRRLPLSVVRWLPRRLCSMISEAAQPDAWRISFEPVTLEELQSASSASASAASAAPSRTAHLRTPSNGLLAPGSPAHGASAADSELQVDALFADVASDEHSILYHGAVALRTAHQEALRLMRPKIPMAHADEAYPANHGAGGNSMAQNLTNHGAGGNSMAQNLMTPPAQPAHMASLSAPAPAVPSPALVGTVPSSPAPVASLDAVPEPESEPAPATAAAPATAPAAAAPAGAEAPAATTSLQPDIELESFLHAFDCGVIKILGCLGPAMIILVKNDEANMRKTRAAAASAASSAAAAAAATTANAAAVKVAAGVASGSIRAILEYEVAKGMHETRELPPPGSGAQGAILFDPSAAISLLWLRRSLRFTIELMERLQQAHADLEDQRALAEALSPDETPPLLADPTAGCVQAAYDAVIRPFHSWLLRKTFDIVATQFPTMPEVIGMVGPGLGEAERERKVFEEMAIYLEHGRPVVALLEQLMGELKLEDLRLV